MAYLQKYCKGDAAHKVVVDFRGVALQSPRHSIHPTLGGGAASPLMPAAIPAAPIVSGYDVGGLHLSGGFRSALPPSKYVKWGGPTVGNNALSWHPWA